MHHQTQNRNHEYYTKDELVKIKSFNLGICESIIAVKTRVVTVRGRQYWKIPYYSMQNKNIAI